MAVVQRKLSKSFKEFFDSEKSSGVLLIICTVVSLAFANSILGANYLSIWQMYIGGLSIEHWVNDALMARAVCGSALSACPASSRVATHVVRISAL
jgi:NhaA family Na+:H+ antiporter